MTRLPKAYAVLVLSSPYYYYYLPIKIIIIDLRVEKQITIFLGEKNISVVINLIDLWNCIKMCNPTTQLIDIPIC